MFMFGILDREIKTVILKPGLTHKTRDPVILPGQLPGWVL
jgi:hypothetical protein